MYHPGTGYFLEIFRTSLVMVFGYFLRLSCQPGPGIGYFLKLLDQPGSGIGYFLKLSYQHGPRYWAGMRQVTS
jgi:hypothetical protein